MQNKTSYRTKGKKILLVEDNELNREIATDILEEAGDPRSAEYIRRRYPHSRNDVDKLIRTLSEILK